MRELVKTETSFRLELLAVLILLPFVFILDVSFALRLFMIFSLFIMLLAEAINSAIERVVDLVTSEHHPLAGQAKDIGSAVVFLSISLVVVTWGLILMQSFGVLSF